MEEYFQKMTLTGLVDIKTVSEPEKKPQKSKSKYVYIGPVYRYNYLIFDNIEITTLAVSEAQALNNVLFQIKKKAGYTAGASGFKLKGSIWKEK